MKKHIILSLLFGLMAICAVAQSPSGFPITKSTGWIEYGYLQNDSGRIDAKRDTNWLPSKVPTTVYWQNAGVDTAFWTFNGKSVGNKRWDKQGSGTGSTLTSVGSGFKVGIDGTNNVKELVAGWGGDYDSLSTNNVRYTVDSNEIKTLIDGNFWGKLGNAGTNDAANFVGTTDNEDLVLKRNSVTGLTLKLGTVEFPSNINIPATSSSTSGVVYRGSQRFLHYYQAPSTQGDNMFMGSLAGNFTLTGSTALGGFYGSYNTAFGTAALSANTTGFRNTAVGTYALQNNTTGFSNHAFGQVALFFNTTGYNNSAFGVRSLLFNTTGHSNSAFGTDALFANTTGEFNSAYCIDAGYRNTTGSYNAYFGDSTMWEGTVGIKNSAFGSRAGYGLGLTYLNFASLKDSMMTFIGADASRDSSIPHTTALLNSTALGYNARVYASNQVSIGNNNVTTLLLRGAMNNRNYGTGVNTGTATYNLQVDASGNIIEGGIPLTAWNITGNSGTTPGTHFVGTTSNVGLMFKTNSVQAGYIDYIFGNISFGYESLLSNSSGSLNTAFGHQALRSSTNSSSNTAVGYRTLYNADGATALYNTAVGESALFASTTGRRNVAVGRRAGVGITTGQINTIVGAYDVSGDQVLSTGGSNTSVGYNTFKFHNGDQNTAVGVAALSGSTGTQVTSGNTAIGYDALFFTQTGDGNNTALGYRSGYLNTTGSSNAFLGDSSGHYNTTASNQIFINTLGRSNYAGDTSASPFYSIQNLTPTSQRIRLNGRIFLEHIPTEVTDTILYYNPSSDEVTYGLKPSGSGSGTVTSVSFTGGLISVATATTTPALTVAGISGGIPYFSSTSTWASSALLSANSLMIGGGAGTAPSTTTTGTGILTFLGTPSSANFFSAITDETGGTGVVMGNISPSVSTSMTTASTTFALFNTTATTVNAFGAATTLNIGAAASGAAINLGGAANAAELRFLEPSAGGTNYTGFKAAAMTVNTVYTLPAAFPAGTYLLQSNNLGGMSFLDPSTLVFTLANGSGTTANTDKVDLGGTVLFDVSIEDDGSGNHNFDIGRGTNFASIRMGATTGYEFMGSAVRIGAYGSGSITGTATYALQVDVDGNIIEGALGGGGTPGGSDTQLQWNNAGSFAGITGATTNGTTVTLVAPILGTPASVTLTNGTGLPVATGISGLGTGVATALAINVGSAGAFVTFNGALGTPSSGTLTNATGLPVATGISGLGTGVATALAVNVGSAGAFVTFNGALGTPSSGTVTNLTGTASININGTVGATTPAAGTFTAAIANSFVPNSSTIPSNGLYLPAANTLGWAINSAAEVQLTSTALSPAVDGGNSLGTTSLGWQNLFGNTGFVLNIENSDWVATHTAGILTVGTGDLRVTTAGTNAASVVTNAGTQTLTNKRITARTGTTASSGTPTINTDNVDYYSITALAANITSFTTNLSGTPSTGDKLWISITDNGTPRTIAWGASFTGSLLPATTVASTNLNVALFWNGSTWFCVASN